MLVVCHMLGGPRGGVQPSHCQNIFIKKKNKKEINWKLKNKTKKNQGNILHVHVVLLHFNQAIVLLWCSHYGINDGPEHAQTGGEN